MQPSPISHREARRASVARPAPRSRQTHAKPVPRVLGVAAALFLGAVAERQAVTLWDPQPTPFARAILCGEEASRARDTDANESATPLDDGYTLGAMWARSHHPTVAGGCPDQSAAFRDGCAAWIGASRP